MYQNRPDIQLIQIALLAGQITTEAYMLAIFWQWANHQEKITEGEVMRFSLIALLLLLPVFASVAQIDESPSWY